MEILTVLQFFAILAAYLTMTFVFPAILLYPKIKKMRFAGRFITYQMVGNFYMMNLVTVLELMHISYRVTLIIFTVVPFTAAYILLYKKHPVQAIKEVFDNAARLAGGQFGLRLFFRRVRLFVWERLKKAMQKLFLRFRENFLDILLVIGLTACLCYAYGYNLLQHFGYCASDIPVHNYWINYLVKNHIFVAGIYPFGFHCVVYYLRTVFGIPTYVLLRIFCFVQTIMVHYILLAFIKCCCKSKYAPYIGVFIYTMVAIFSRNTFSRYYSSLPQEFGMLFILPSAYYLYLFFEKREKKTKKEDLWYLFCFAISFSMTIEAHFYNTMIAGLFCMGIAVGYGFRLFRRKYFGKVMLAGIVGVAIAVLPMVIAFAMGTPLQGSLGWGMNVITGNNNKKTAETESVEATETSGDETVSTGEAGAAGTGAAAGTMRVTETEETETAPAEEKPPLTERLVTVAKRLPQAFWNAMIIYLIPGNYPLFRLAVPGAMALLVVFSFLYFLLRQTDYAARLLSLAAFLALLSVLLGASRAGLPALMDAIRTCIFYAYVLTAAWSLCVDAVLQLLFGWWKKKWLLHLVSLVLVCGTVVCAAERDMLKDLPDSAALQTNSAITCLTNVLHDNKDFTWTICSANDELRMGEDYGYHYETHTFLREMEYSGSNGLIIIPTTHVYFFIEKIPIDYSVAYEGSGQSVSREGASRPLPNGGGISIYQGESRWIEMSRMYYWAQEFMRLYPNEMTVYYESEDYICYCVEQDLYRPLNFAIDYGYNTAANLFGGNE